MSTIPIGIILSGVTGRMGTNQHLDRSLLDIIRTGGVVTAGGDTLMPVPVLLGRDGARLKAIAEARGGLAWSTDAAAVLRDPANRIFFDASTTAARVGLVRQAIDAGKAIYCEKPVATTSREAMDLASRCRGRGLPNGVVQDKLWLPGIRALREVLESGRLGKVLSVRGEFGYWVFTGEDPDRKPQRPSWNYRSEDGGGIILDMFSHWSYLLGTCFAPVTAVSCLGATHIGERIDERGLPYACTAEDAAYATFELGDGTICQFASSWAVRVRRDDLLTLQVDGTAGSAVAGLRTCRVQSLERTPRAVWNPDVPNPIDVQAGWEEVTPPGLGENAFKAQWELFLRHVVDRTPFPWDLAEGARGVQLAELALMSWRERRWIPMTPL